MPDYGVQIKNKNGSVLFDELDEHTAQARAWGTFHVDQDILLPEDNATSTQYWDCIIREVNFDPVGEPPIILALPYASDKSLSDAPEYDPNTQYGPGDRVKAATPVFFDTIYFGWRSGSGQRPYRAITSPTKGLNEPCADDGYSGDWPTWRNQWAIDNPYIVSVGHFGYKKDGDDNFVGAYFFITINRAATSISSSDFSSQRFYIDCYVDWVAISKEPVTEGTGYGINIYNSQGEPIFSSEDEKHPRIDEGLDYCQGYQIMGAVNNFRIFDHHFSGFKKHNQRLGLQFAGIKITSGKWTWRDRQIDEYDDDRAREYKLWGSFVKYESRSKDKDLNFIEAIAEIISGDVSDYTFDGGFPWGDIETLTNDLNNQDHENPPIRFPFLGYLRKHRDD